ncbi:FtsK/SpoIIIE domain-containing protein [Streptomyces luteolus]|uniref:FtsK/SpoIIIE domain-containing protein n=1 Tax=Streptomyces luteolus TaxID=3043615 RepID=A0ABT6SSI6_9ACTN|nr:FtsK/SpoIIIE domain-containing protein [Streptomyces sp. B-S-A12]MDI3418564.1 FtsK/SpoIIIE domain-containing protein [Streptomyces sp. B-S-A12]
MDWFLVVLVLVVAAAGLLRWRRPAWYWMTFGVTLAGLRVLVRYGSVMDACGLTVPPARWRLTLARLGNRPVPGPRAPRVLRLRPTRTGLVLRIKLRPGQDAYDVAASTDRLRHSFGMYGVSSRELRSGVVEIAMTGYDVLKRVQLPARAERSAVRVPVALREDGAVHYRDYRRVPHALTLGATESGKSVYQRGLIAELASQDVALVGIDCKQGVEHAPMARRFSALADNPDSAELLLAALVEHMQDVYQLIRAHQRISADTLDAEIAADIWDLPEDLRPVPVVVLVDEVAELALFASRDEEKRRDRIITSLVRLAQLGRAAGVYLEICGQRFGSELGKGITMLRAQLTGRTAHRVNDETSANMAFGDIAPDAVLAAIQIPTETPGVAVAADMAGGWSRIRAPHTTLRQAVNACNRHAHCTPELPHLAAFRPELPHLNPVPAPAVETAPVAA